MTRDIEKFTGTVSDHEGGLHTCEVEYTIEEQDIPSIVTHYTVFDINVTVKGIGSEYLSDPDTDIYDQIRLGSNKRIEFEGNINYTYL